jgi:hypothetical protein
VSVHVVVVGADRIAERFANPAKRLELLASAIEAHLGLIWQAVVPLTPVGVTGVLRSSWQADPVQFVGGMPVGVLGTPLLYGAVMEEGRTPGARMPPPDAIARWVELKMGPGVSPYVVARSIGRKGIKGRHMLRTAVETTRPQAQAIYDEVGARLLPES